jgi:hypothetical protein
LNGTRLPLSPRRCAPPRLGADRFLIGERVVVCLESPERAAVPVQQPVAIVREARRDQRAGRLHRVARVEDDFGRGLARAVLPERHDRGITSLVGGHGHLHPSTSPMRPSGK